MEDVLYFWEFFFKSKEYWDGFMGDLSQEKYAQFGSTPEEIKASGNKLMEQFDITQFEDYVKPKKLELIDFKELSYKLDNLNEECKLIKVNCEVLEKFYEEMISINRSFDKIIKNLEQDGVLKN